MRMQCGIARSSNKDRWFSGTPFWTCKRSQQIWRPVSISGWCRSATHMDKANGKEHLRLKSDEFFVRLSCGETCNGSLFFSEGGGEIETATVTWVLGSMFCPQGLEWQVTSLGETSASLGKVRCRKCCSGECATLCRPTEIIVVRCEANTSGWWWAQRWWLVLDAMGGFCGFLERCASCLAAIRAAHAALCRLKVVSHSPRLWTATQTSARWQCRITTKRRLFCIISTHDLIQFPWMKGVLNWKNQQSQKPLDK